MNTACNLFEHVAEIKLSLSHKVKASDRPQIVTSKDAADIFRTRYPEGSIELREEFWVMYLSRANKVLGVLQISAGGTTGTVVDTRFVLSGLVQQIVKCNACSVILCHNHPSGNTKPSQLDIDLTKKIREACKLIDCTLMDHVILAPEESYYSFADEGIV